MRLDIGLLSWKVSREIGCLERHEPVGPQWLTSSFFSDGGEVLTKLLGPTWTKWQILKNWYELVIVPIFKEGDKTLCENHRGISLVSNPANCFGALSSADYLVLAGNVHMGIKQSFVPIEVVLTKFLYCDRPYNIYTFRGLIITVFLDCKAVFDSGAACHRRVCKEKSFRLFARCKLTTEVEFAVKTGIQPTSSREVVGRQSLLRKQPP